MALGHRGKGVYQFTSARRLLTLPSPVQYGKGKLRTTVFFEDLLKLDEGEYLSDSLIMFYMA